MDFLIRLFDTSGYPPRWRCGQWTSAEGWLHIVSDLGIWSAYLAIPVVLSYFTVRKAELPFRRIFLLFAAFIVACGTTHLMEAIIFWWPAYRLAGAIKLLTAVISWTTVVALVPIVPKALAMRSPEELEREVAARIEAEKLLRQANATLDERVRERTAELADLNAVLHNEREWFRTTLASIGDAVITTDTQGRVTLLNPVAESLTRWKQTEAQGTALESVFKIVHETNRLPVESPVAKVLQQGSIVGLANHTVLIAKDGTERPIDDSAAPIRDVQGRVMGVVMVFRDATEHRQAASILRESERQKRQVLEALPQLIWTCQPDGPCDYLSRQWCEYMGVSEAAHLGYGWTKAVHPEDLARVKEEWNAAVKTGRDFHVTFRLRGADGEYRWFKTRATPLRDSAGKIIKWIGSNTDIDDQKQAEAALRESDRRKSEFLATLAHELRNPLAPIRNAVQIMRVARSDEPAVRSAREMIDRQVTQMVRLIDDLLDLARISRNQLELRREWIDLATALQSAVETSRPLFRENHQELSVTLPPQPIVLHADPTRLAQVFINLLNNAAKYSHKKGRVEITAERQDSDVVVKVRDWGIGIPGETMPHIFEMFTQGDQSLERSRGGLGIGLSLVQRLVEMHGGHVDADSDGPGKGSEFTVHLPAAFEPAHQPSKSDVASPPPGITKRRILIVDDNIDAAMSLEMLLQSFGHETRMAHDGLEALETADKFRPDVVLLDIGMPKLNGYDVARRIREQPWGRKIVLVAATGWGQADDQRRAQDAGFDHHMVKPINLDALADLLNTHSPK